jgi:trans-aconitate 2-methyltransferase
VGSSAQKEWDAQTYHEVSDPQVEWARGVLARAKLTGGERVLDAGCGAGRVTRLLIDELPDGHVIAVDASHQMLEQAAEHLADATDRVSFHRSDLTDLAIDEPVDLVFSNAVFHWILDHDELFARLSKALRPSGVLVAQCGGAGNIAEVIAATGRVSDQAPFAAYLADFDREWFFAGPDETKARLERAGFVDVATNLEPRDAVLPIGGHAERYLMAIVLRLHMELLRKELRYPFAEAVARELADDEGFVTLDHVRLNITAKKA